MPLIKWTDNYSINIKEMDEQHKKLVGIINDIWEAKQIDKDFEVLEKTFTDLIEYIEFHFGNEERLLEQHNYDYFDVHRLEHKIIIEEISNLHKKYCSGNNIVAEMVHFLSSWLTGHILDKDKKYAVFLNSKGVK
ncbi:MAG: hemerythrin [Gammaproteobacteria bacterium]|nr:hemerythrin [Gammaproteobacteria bacterium]HJP19015.1 bacteriohemerythrin [Nitrospinota bacterium]|tara:strand:+ start:1546 stop:1950 length:405 start_codon:yes stop_codon:yes gene_type:complete